MPKISRDSTDQRLIVGAKSDLGAAMFAKMGHRVAEQIERKILGRPVVYVGIDPGASGGVAWVGDYFEHGDGKRVETTSLGNLTDKQIWDWFIAPGPFGEERPAVTFAVIEANTGYVGGAGNPGSTMFKFGVSTGKLLGFLTAAGIPFETATPRTWQKALGVAARKKTESKTQFKNRLKQRAEQLFPSLKITLSTCDALLIAEFCRRNREGLL